MKHITYDPRRPLAVAAQQLNYRIHPETGRLYDPETGRPLHGMLIDHRYELIREIGRGGSCICYHALDRESGSFVAIKEWFPISFAQEGMLVRQGNALVLTLKGKTSEAKIRNNFETDFVREADMSRRQQHTEINGHLNNDPHVFSLKLLRTGPWMQYLVIETESGMPLNEVQFNHSDPQKKLGDILATAIQIAGKLEWLHLEKQILHCDLKPSNIYVSDLYTGEENNVSSHVLRLIDYGSGFPLDEKGYVQKESVTHLSFSAKYASPELQALRDEDRWKEAVEQLSPAADVYSVLRILLELLAPDADPEELCSADLWESSVLEHLPEPVIEYFCEFFENALSTKRLKTAAELRSALEKLKEMAEECISWEWLRFRSEACALQQVRLPRLFPMTFWRSFGEQQSLTAFAATLPRNLILTGIAGAGKTTVMGQLANRLLKQETNIPLQIPLREFDGSQNFIKDWILYRILQLKHGDSDEQNRRKLMNLFAQTGGIYLLLDGYDEVSEPDTLCGEMEKLAKCSGIQLVVSSRYLPKKAFFEEAEHAELCPLSKGAIREILDESGLPGGDNENLLAMLATPLWLNLYLNQPNDGQAAPKTSAELMGRHVKYLKDKAKRSPLLSRQEDLILETLDVLLPCFSWHLAQRRWLSFDARQARNVLVQCVEELDAADTFDPMRRDAVPDAKCLAAGVVREILIPLGLVEEQSGRYFFVHALFRDYFASCEIYRQLNENDLPAGLSAGPLTETVAAFLAEMDEVNPEALLGRHCRGKRGTEYAMSVRNLVEILKLRHKGDLSGRNLSDIDLTVTDLVGCELSRNGTAPANLQGSLLADYTFDPVLFDHICGEPPFPIPSARRIVMEAGKRTVLLDMDTLCIMKSIQALFVSFHLWNDCLWGVEDTGLAIWKIIPRTGQETRIPLERPADHDSWNPRLVVNGKLYLNGNVSRNKCAFDLTSEQMVPLEAFPPEVEQTADGVVRSLISGDWNRAGTGELLYRVQEHNLYLMDAATKEEWFFEDLPKDILSSVRRICWDGETLSILTLFGKFLLVNGERRERIALNQMPLVDGIHVTEDECLEVVSRRTRSLWALEDGALCRRCSGITQKIDNVNCFGHHWGWGTPVIEKTATGVLDVKGFSEPGLALLTYSPVGARKTELMLSGVDAAFSLGNGTVAIKRRRECGMEVYGPDSEDATQLAGRFMHPTGEIFSPDAVVWWHDGLVLYHHDSACEGFAGRDNKSRIYYVTEHESHWVPFADLLVQDCDLTDCEGLSDETKTLLRTYGAII